MRAYASTGNSDKSGTWCERNLALFSYRRMLAAGPVRIGNLKKLPCLGSFLFFSKRYSSQDLRKRTEDACARATARETRKAAPSAPPIGTQLGRPRSPTTFTRLTGGLGNRARSSGQSYTTAISPSFSPIPATLGPRIFELHIPVPPQPRCPSLVETRTGWFREMRSAVDLFSLARGEGKIYAIENWRLLNACFFNQLQKEGGYRFDPYVFFFYVCPRITPQHMDRF